MVRACLLTFIALLWASIGEAEEKKVKLNVGIIEFFPLVTFEKGDAEGPLLDFASKILQQAGFDPVYKEVSINRALEELKNRHLHMVLTLFKTPEREVFIKFSKEPLLVAASGICSLTDIKLKPLAKTDRVGHVRGTILAPIFQKLTLFPINSEKAQTRMLQMLVKNRIEVIYSPKPEVIMLAALRARIPNPLFCYKLKDQQMPIYFGFSQGVDENVFSRIDESLHKALKIEDFDRFLQNQMIKEGMAHPQVLELDPASIP